MTDKYIDISKEYAKAAKIPMPEGYIKGKVELGMTERWGDTEHGKDLIVGWLVHDNAACAKLAAEYRINIIQSSEVAVLVSWTEYRTPKEVWALLADHNNDRMLSTNYAILSAIIEILKAKL